MAVDIKVPSVGESITEGTIARWLKKDGDAVRADEPVVELETEKASTEVASPVAGILHIRVPEGETVTIGSVIGTVEAGQAPPAAAEKKKSSEVSALAAPPARPKVDEKKIAAEARPTPTEAMAPLAPSARRLAAEEGIDVRAVRGSGRGGRVTREDVITYLQSREQPQPVRKDQPTQAVPAKPPPDHDGAERKDKAERETRQRMSAVRQRIAERLVASQKTTATLTTFKEADLSAVIELRNRYKEKFKEKHGVSLGFMAFFVKACVEALKAYPLANARIDGGDIVYHNYYNLGIAVSTEKGLMVPVLHDADRMGFAEIEQAIAALAAKARDGKITVQDLQGGTFTITNGGVFGSLLSTPILNPPQSAILGMHTIQKRPVVVGEQIVIRPMMYLALSYDHRLIDGREAVLFLARVKECVEDPERLMLEV
jgi:2-oxoglutarate dehydrogenase E2 component (dihydrolipoamide succinyltransferase)